MRIASSATTTARNDTAFTKNTHATPTDADEQAGDRGAGDARRVADRARERDRVRRRVSRPTISSTKAWRAGSSTTVTKPEPDREREHHPHVHDAGEHDQPQDDREQRRERLRDEQHRAAVEAVGDRAAPQPEQQHREEPEREGGADRDAAVRQLEHQPGLGHRLHPAADVRDEVAGEVEAVVVRVERAERAPYRATDGAPRRWRGDAERRSPMRPRRYGAAPDWSGSSIAGT